MRAALPGGGGSENARAGATVELASLCRERLEREELPAPRRPAAASDGGKPGTSPDIFEAFVECVSFGDLKQATLAIKFLLRGYAKASSRAARGCLELLFRCLDRATTISPGSHHQSHNVMPLVTSIQYCYLEGGWMQTYDAGIGGANGTGSPTASGAGQSNLPLLRVIQICEGATLRAEEIHSSLRLAVQMVLQNVSKAIDRIAGESVSLCGSAPARDVMGVTKVQRILAQFAEILLPNLILKANLGGRGGPGSIRGSHGSHGGAFLNAWTDLAVFSLQELRKLVLSKLESAPTLALLVGKLVTGRFLTTLAIASADFDARVVEILDHLLDFLRLATAGGTGGGESIAGAGIRSRLQTLLLQVCITRGARQKPLTDVLPLLACAHTESGEPSEGAGREETGGGHCAHLAYLAMADNHLDSDTLVALFSRTLRLGRGVGGRSRRKDDAMRPRHIQALIEIVTLVTFVNRLKIGLGVTSLLPLDILEMSTPKPKISPPEVSLQTLLGQMSQGKGYHSEGRLPMVMECALLRLTSSSSAETDAVAFARRFMDAALGIRNTRSDPCKESDLALCVALSLVRHTSLRVKRECVSRLGDLCRTFPSFQEPLAVCAFLQIRDLLRGGAPGGGCEWPEGAQTRAETLKAVLHFVLTCNRTPITMMLAKRSLQAMVSPTGIAGGERKGPASHPRVYANALDTVTRVIEETGSDAQCEDFLKILFAEAQRITSSAGTLGTLEGRAVAACVSRALKAFPGLSIEWVNILDQMLGSSDDVVTSIAVETLHDLCKMGVFDHQSALRVLEKRVMAVKGGEGMALAWLRFQNLFVTEDMTEEEVEDLLGRVRRGAGNGEGSREWGRALYELMSRLPYDLVMHQLKEEEHQKVSQSPSHMASAEAFVSRVVAEEARLLRHRKAHAGGPGGAQRAADSVWSASKRRLHSLGKRIAFDGVKRNLGEFTRMAHMVWTSCDARPSQQGLRHSLKEFSAVFHTHSAQALSSRFPSSFHLAESTWNAFVSSWLQASDAVGDLNDRVDIVCKAIEKGEEKGIDASLVTMARAAVIGYTRIADEQAYQVLPSLLVLLTDGCSSLQTKAWALSGLSLLAPGLKAHQDTLAGELVATLTAHLQGGGVDPKIEKIAWELLGKACYCLVRSKIPDGNLIVMSVTAALLGVLSGMPECESIFEEVNAAVPSAWKPAAQSRKERNVAEPSGEAGQGSILGLGWVAKAALDMGDEDFCRAIKNSITRHLSTVTIDGIVEGSGESTHRSLCIYTGSALVCPSLLWSAAEHVSDDLTTYQEAERLLGHLEAIHEALLRETRSQPYLQPTAACLGSLVAFLAEKSPSGPNLLTQNTIRSVARSVTNEKLSLEARLGCALGIGNIAGCSALTMPCFPNSHKDVRGLTINQLGDDTVSELLGCLGDVIGSDACDPFLKSVVSWVSQIIHYAMCHSHPSGASKRERLANFVFEKGSYIGLCVTRLEEYQDCLRRRAPISEELGRSVICALRALNGVQDLETLNTVKIACGAASAELEGKESPNLALLEACFDIISTHKNTKDCLVSKDVTKVIRFFQDGRMDDPKLAKVFLSNLSAVLAISAEEDVRLLFKSLGRSKWGSRGALCALIWKGIGSYIRTICSEKPRRYKLVRDSVVAFALCCIQGMEMPTYVSAMNAWHGKSREMLEEGEGLGVDRVWFSVSSCMGEWQACDEDFSYREEVAGDLSTEKNLVVILMVDRIGVADLARCQEWYLGANESQSRWMLPLITRHTTALAREEKIDIKQWMLDLLDHAEGLTPTSLALLSSVLLCWDPGSTLCSLATEWVSHDFGPVMLPYSLPRVLGGLPVAFGRLWAHRFLVSAVKALSGAGSDSRLAAALIAIKRYFCDGDFDAFAAVMSSLELPHHPKVLQT